MKLEIPSSTAAVQLCITAVQLWITCLAHGGSGGADGPHLGGEGGCPGGGGVGERLILLVHCKRDFYFFLLLLLKFIYFRDMY